MNSHALGTWYTLAVIDENGRLGKAGAVIVPSRPIDVLTKWEQVQVGQAVPTTHLPHKPPNLTHVVTLRTSKTNEYRTFRRWILASLPSGVSRTLEAWERIE